VNTQTPRRLDGSKSIQKTPITFTLVRAGQEVHALARLVYLCHDNIRMSNDVTQKKRGRPATGQQPHVTMRLPVELIAALESYASAVGAKSRNEAIRSALTEFLTERDHLQTGP
jgi:hypothetical protein